MRCEKGKPAVRREHKTDGLLLRWLGVLTVGVMERETRVDNKHGKGVYPLHPEGRSVSR